MAEDASSSTGGKEPHLSDGLLAAALAGTGSPKVDALLDRQIAIADLQIEDLEREDSLRHWSLIVRHISDVLKLTFEFALAGIALAIVIGLGVAVWSAAHDNSLVIDAFSVPPDLAARGLTGHAIAAQVQDQLTGMQKLTGSARPANSYANNWGGDIKVQIPDTGVSIGEFYRMLVLWFGDQTHVTGEVFHAGKAARDHRAGRRRAGTDRQGRSRRCRSPRQAGGRKGLRGHAALSVRQLSRQEFFTKPQCPRPLFATHAAASRSWLAPGPYLVLCRAGHQRRNHRSDARAGDLAPGHSPGAGICAGLFECGL